MKVKRGKGYSNHQEEKINYACPELKSVNIFFVYIQHY